MRSPCRISWQLHLLSWTECFFFMNTRTTISCRHVVPPKRTGVILNHYIPTTVTSLQTRAASGREVRLPYAAALTTYYFISDCVANPSITVNCLHLYDQWSLEQMWLIWRLENCFIIVVIIVIIVIVAMLIVNMISIGIAILIMFVISIPTTFAIAIG